MIKLTGQYMGKDLTIVFTARAVKNIVNTCADWTEDYHDLRTGQVTPQRLLDERLLELCVQDAYYGDVQGWTDYVDCLVAAAARK